MTDNHAAPAAALGDPPFICVFGDPGTGKTLDSVLSWPDSYVLCLPGSLMGARTVVGDALYQSVLANTARVDDLEQAVAFVESVASGQYAPKPILIDDITVLSDATLTKLDAFYPSNKVFQKWAHYDKIVQSLRSAGRRAQVPVRMTAHRRDAGKDDFGATVRGGLEAGGKRAKGRLEAVLDIVYGVYQDTDQWPHPSRYVCRPHDSRMVYKDRMHALDGTGPMNLREIMRRAGGYVGTRPAGLEWLDDVAEQVADRVAAGTPVQTVYAEVMPALVEQGAYKGHAYWALRDGFARAELRTAGDFFDQVLAEANAPGDTEAPPSLSGALS